MNIDEIMEEIKETLELYGVDWKMNDAEYYMNMISEIKIRIKRLLK